MTIDQLSDKARELLTSSLAGEGRLKGWIALTQTLGGGGYVLLVVVKSEFTATNWMLYDGRSTT